MIVYKFLRAGGTAPFSGFVWPLPEGTRPGAWVGTDRPLRVCVSGIHACGREHLPYWIDEVLWLTELEDPVIEHETVVLSARGRLLQPLEVWGPETRDDLGRACAWRARDLAVSFLRRLGLEQQGARLEGCRDLVELEETAAGLAGRTPAPAGTAIGFAGDAARYRLSGAPHTAAFVAARLAALISSASPAAFRAERAWQAAWVSDRLGL